MGAEGIGYVAESQTLLIASSRRGADLVQTTTSGDLVLIIEGSGLDIRSAAGLVFGPGSADPSVSSLYIADRGHDNETDPAENDGKVYEITF